MNLDAVTAELRPRSPWEAVDFGARMVRRDAAAIYRVWFALTLPLLAIALTLMYFDISYFWAMMFFWWLEPITDGPILHIIAHRLFGEEANAREALKKTPQLAAQNKIFLLPLYRFHFARSIAIPITQLEGLSGDRRRTRSKILNQGIYNHGVGVTMAYHHLLMALYLGVVLLGFMFIPTQYQDTIGLTWMDQFWASDSREANMTALIVIYIAQSALHPWFVGAGFGLYINRRTMLEAWDVEVAFRRMVNRREQPQGAALAVLLCVFLGFTADKALAQDDDEPYELPGIAGYWDDEEVAPALESAYEADELATSYEDTRWQRIDPPEEEDEASTDKDSGSAFSFEGLRQFFALLVEFGLWIALAAALVLLFITRAVWLPYLRPAPRTRVKRHRVILAGGEITADSLPDNVPTAAMKLWRDGKRREALSLLYRGAVFAAVSDHQVRIPTSATEGMCISAVRAQCKDTTFSALFETIVMAWVRLSYGGREVANESFATLCDSWPQPAGDRS